MMWKHCLPSAGLVALLTFAGASAAEIAPDNPDSQEFKKQCAANRVRVESLAKQAKNNSSVQFFSVQPMSEIMRLATVYPEDGQFGGELRMKAAQGEYEPASFQLFAFKDQKNVTVSASALKSKSGASIPAKNVDVKVVKIWYQNGNRWTSYFSDVGLRLVPEMLLYDENMVLVDTKNTANYARIRKDGKDSFEWISAPKGLDAEFDAMQKGFEDAASLQSVTLAKDQFKQFFVTVHVPENQTPGVYSGTISVSADGDRLAIPLKVRVLPFALPLPETYQKPGMPVICSIMGGFSLDAQRKYYKDEALALARFKENLANAKAHGMLHPNVDSTKESIDIIKAMGFPTNVFLGGNFMPWFARNFGGRLTFDNMMAAKAASEKARKFYLENLGHTDNVLTSYGDEQGTAFVTCHRNFHKYFERYGIRVASAGHSALFYKGAHLFGYHPMGGYPDDESRIKRWRDMGDKFIGFYAGQHTGSENPAFIRRQNGMLGWLHGLNLLYNYEFAIGPWNDLVTEVYKPMVVAYQNYGGLVDTLQWEGYREAVDDIRYATLLQQEIAKGLASDDIEYKTQARKALLFFAVMEPVDMDLDAVRDEMIVHILKLKSMAPKKG